MISVEAARAALFELVSPLDVETVPLRAAAGRVLARDVHAQRAQPPFDASSMDGYALRRADATAGAKLSVIGEAAAGHAFQGSVCSGEAVRIFTGAPLPEGADTVVIQENAQRDGQVVILTQAQNAKDNIRPAAGDFAKGATLAAPLLLRPVDIALLAAMNVAEVPVTRKPRVAVLATGDELVQPGEHPRADQIVASNSYGLAAMLEAMGAEVSLLPIAKDTAASLRQAFQLAAQADLILTIGGASVGDHDLVAPVAAEMGLQSSFYKVAMRPGKPLMAGRMGRAAMIGLPGNPVSALVCGTVFVRPVLRKMLGLGEAPPPTRAAPLGTGIAPNGPRAHYMRAHVENGTLFPHGQQDSSLLHVLAQSDALLIRPVADQAREAGEICHYIPL
ncbi:MAG: gephyrin-like molybdotransferase Glp [Pseudomonadota bacterium]